MVLEIPSIFPGIFKNSPEEGQVLKNQGKRDIPADDDNTDTQTTNTGAINPGTMADDATVGTWAWSNPNNAKLSDDTYANGDAVANGGLSHYLKATNFGFAIPAGAVINGIVVEIEKNQSGIAYP